MFRPERPAAFALVLAAISLGACGKSNLVRLASSSSTAVVAPPTSRQAPTKPPPAKPPEAVAVPLKLTAARAAKFARAVNLRNVDVPGSHNSPRTPSTESDRQEAAECKHEEVPPIGGGRSPRLDRGRDLEAESISSSVVVMPTAGDAKADLAYAESRAGLACYSKLLARKLTRESNPDLSIGRVRIAPLRLRSESGEPMSGIRIEARIRGVKSGLTLEMFVDVVALQHGPAEIQLYATSFVQPVPTKTEVGLLSVMRARARLSRL